VPDLWHPTVPGFDCLSRGHIWVEQHVGHAYGSWCLWCGSGVTNEHEPEAIPDWRQVYGSDWEPTRCDFPPCRLCFPEATE
jgi:hypothetical protein